MSANHIGRFSPAQSRAIVDDLFEHNPTIYWADLLLTVTIGYSCAVYYLTAPGISALRVACFIIAGLALYRASMFMHEIVHFKSKSLTTFRVVWNLLVGVPMLTPSFFYESHMAHHRTQHYGTKKDAEYLPLGTSTLRELVLYFSQVFLQPILVVTRFLLSPITFLHPRLRQWTLERASSFVLNFSYRRSIPSDAPRASWAGLELLCSLRAALIFIFVILGINSWTRIIELYLLANFILTLNYTRTLTAHVYLNDGKPMSFVDQLLDSTNITGGLLTELLCPLGLRYHALHHFLPAMPYHNLSLAHRRLMAELPEDSPYRRSEYTSQWSVIRLLFQNMRSARLRNLPEQQSQYHRTAG